VIADKLMGYVVTVLSTVVLLTITHCTVWSLASDAEIAKQQKAVADARATETKALAELAEVRNAKSISDRKRIEAINNATWDCLDRPYQPDDVERELRAALRGQ
jgi:hypothetical protein